MYYICINTCIIQPQTHGSGVYPTQIALPFRCGLWYSSQAVLLTPEIGPHIATKEIRAMRCMKCEHTWIPRLSTMPKICPRRKSKRFWLPKVHGVGRKPRIRDKETLDQI